MSLKGQNGSEEVWLSSSRRVAESLFKELLVTDLKNPPKGCVDMDGKQHDLGSEWVRDCMECSCTKEGLSCFSKIPDPGLVFVPEECELIVNKEACSAKTVLKSDKNKECNPI
ncbi:beta-microseminoprotein [Aulostomus maculatus]